MPHLLQHYVTDQAAIQPERPAINWKGQVVSYGELDSLTNRLAELMRESGTNPGDRVAFCIPKSPAAIVSMVGALKADCVYVPIDADCPPARVAKVLESCRPKWLLGSKQTARLIDQVFGDNDIRNVRVGCLDDQEIGGDHFTAEFNLNDLEQFSDHDHSYVSTASDAAHILFTSGSTGVPKGVVITHEMVTAFVNWGVDYFDISSDDRVSGHAPLHFDLSTFDIYGAFAAGAELFPVPPELNLLPHRLAGFIRDNELTQWFSVPSILNYLAKFDAVPERNFPSLKRLMWCGEVLPVPTLIYLMERLQDVQFTNLYGPTEATIASSYFTMPFCPESETEQTPIGVPCQGEDLLVLDADLKPTPVGEIGDLYIGGIGLSPGYWEDEEKTNAVFLTHPQTGERIYRTGDLAREGDDGLVYFIGRADTQIKSRGYRIELGEIETGLSALTCLDESAVVAIDTEGFENKLICCAFVPAEGEGTTDSEPARASCRQSNTGDSEPHGASCRQSNTDDSEPQGASCRQSNTADSEPIGASCRQSNTDVRRVRKELADHVPKYMIPTLWKSFEQLPKNANGKIDRPELRRLFAAQHQEQSETESSRTAGVV